MRGGDAVEFILLREEHLETILRWRTSEQVTRYMYTDIPYDMEQQRQWYESVKNDLKNRYWVIRHKEQLIGLISLNQIDMQHRHATVGFYIGDSAFHIIGGLIHPYFYNYVFKELGLHKVYAEVMDGNENICKMHRMYGLRNIGMYKEHIFKYGKYHDVHIFELLAETWEQQQRFAKYVAVVEE